MPHAGMPGWILRLDRAIQYLNAAAVAASLFGMFAVVSTTVVARYVFGIGIFWGEELARYLMIYMALLGAAVALRTDQHPRLTLVLMMLSPKWQRIMQGLTNLLLLIAILVLFWQGLDIAVEEGVMRTPSLRITYFWVFLALPIGAVAMFIQLVAMQFMPPALEALEDDIPEVNEEFLR